MGPNWFSHVKNASKHKLMIEEIETEATANTQSSEKTRIVNSESGMTESLGDGVKAVSAMQTRQNKQH